MLSADSIDKLVQPIIDRQEYWNTYIIKKIANRIKEVGELTPSDTKTLEQMVKNGADVREINTTLSALTDLQVHDIQQLIREVAILDYANVKAFYDYRELPYIPFEKNTRLQQIVNTVAQQTASSYVNLSKTQAFMIRDEVTGKLKPTSLTETYYKSVDKAIQGITTGSIDYRTAMRETLQELVDSGIKCEPLTSNQAGVRRVEWDSGYRRRLDSSVRMNVLDGVRELNLAMQDELGKQFGSDGKEITVVMNPAPDHAPVQGYQFTNEEFEKMQNDLPFQNTNGKEYPAMERAIGIWNCRHIAYSIILGVMKPNYTPEKLQQILDKNEKGYTTKDGKHYTMYECRQYQRQVEANIRRLKDGQIAFKAAGDEEKAREYQAKIDKQIQQYMLFSNNCGLRPELGRIFVQGYKRIKI